MRKAGVYLEGRFMLEHGEAEEILDAWFAGFSPPADSDPQLVQLLSN
jgi:hypothetical protein